MTKSIIEMPQNDASYYRKAHIAIDNKDYRLAMEYLEKSLASEFNLPVFNELVNLYLLLKETDKLIEGWESLEASEENIFKLDPLAVAYLSSLKYMRSRSEVLLSLYHAKNNYQMSPTIEKAVDDYIHYLENQSLLEKELKSLSDDSDYDKWFKIWSNQSPTQQLHVLKNLYGLDFNLTNPIYQRVLANSQILQFIKSDVLHALIYRNISDEYQLVWKDQTFTIHTDNLVPYNQQPIYQDLVAEIEKYSIQENPHLFDELVQQLNLQLMVMYPFADKIITQPAEWINLLLSDYQLSDSATASSDEKLYENYLMVVSELGTLMG